MRTSTILLVSTTLVLTALLAPAVGAQAPEGAKERHDALVAARHAAIDSFKENRTAALAAYHASLNATKASFLENKTALHEACDASATANQSGNNSASAHCVRDGMKPLIEKARSEIKTAQDTLRAALQSAREAAKASFQGARADADRRHPRSA